MYTTYRLRQESASAKIPGCPAKSAGLAVIWLYESVFGTLEAWRTPLWSVRDRAMGSRSRAGLPNKITLAIIRARAPGGCLCLPQPIGPATSRECLHRQLSHVPHACGDEPNAPASALVLPKMFPTHVGMNRHYGA